jgi:hypothetical protein
MKILKIFLPIAFSMLLLSCDITTKVKVKKGADQPIQLTKPVLQ